MLLERAAVCANIRALGLMHGLLRGRRKGRSSKDLRLLLEEQPLLDQQLHPNPEKATEAQRRCWKHHQSQGCLVAPLPGHGDFFGQKAV